MLLLLLMLPRRILRRLTVVPTRPIPVPVVHLVPVGLVFLGGWV